ncbi:kinesin family member 2/24 [Fistulifera solaris]|uniref:Kinesin-like protein n=1 Tax=Fistulifera solaris TaxID=1519565 RepID=A0A1Z5KJJ7_FISSO|nr:kinesin family member 2/24 [Fistulifera solaris]|eukprot:GAX26272.1 kinesin family member 2/24 [Fistulifera solaris]
MGLVATWLNGIGLSYAVPTFHAAGIDNPAALAQLDVSHFEALGVKDGEDRRKLFFLVQRIKMACDKSDQTSSEVDSVLAKTMGPSLSLNASQAVEPDLDMKQSSSQQPSKENQQEILPPANQSPRPMRRHVDTDLKHDDDESFLENKASLSNQKEDISKPGKDSTDSEPTATSVEELPTNTSTVTTRRTSRRIAEQKPVSERQSKLAAPGKRSSSLNRLSADTESKINSRRTTGLLQLGPAEPRSIAMRVNKRLSVIPAETVAPMSPLGELLADKMDTKALSDLPSVQLSDLHDQLSVSTSNSSGDKASRQSRFSRSLTNPDIGRPSIGGHQHRSSSMNGRVSVQGRKVDTSFKAQIEKLRQENIQEFEMFGKPDANQDAYDDNMRIRVMVRKRPMSRSEIVAAGDVDVIHPFDHGSYGRLLVYNPKTRVDLTKTIEALSFSFDNVFDEKSTNAQIYETAIRGMIPNLFEGQWASIFAYGQTGSGKTFTMMGSTVTGLNENTFDPSNLGLYYMAALDLFQAIRTPGFEHFGIRASLFEIYGGKLYDLLNDKGQVKCLEDSAGRVCFPGLTEHAVYSADELMDIIDQGSSFRATGSTSRNADSSRSHAVLQLHLVETTQNGKNQSEFSRLTFIDLAGSERGADTATASRATRLEGSDINTSLLALKEVIRALATGDSMAHVPFRGSRLTQVLKESFVGENSQSVMIACVSPNIGNVEPTLNTLRYADRVKERNSETGELSAAVASNMRRKVNGRLPPPSKINSMKRSNSIETDNSEMLEELLASPKQAERPTSVDIDYSTLPEDNKCRELANELIMEHKRIMSEMLAMVKDEMTIVNQADADHEGLKEYVSQLNAVHEQQLSHIAILREHLLAYRIAQTGGDDSFEDLRD